MEPGVKPYVMGEGACVILDGELDLGRRGEISAALPAPESISGGAINLANASYVDSTVLGALVRFRRSFEKTGLNRLFAIAYVEPAPIPPEERICVILSRARAPVSKDGR